MSGSPIGTTTNNGGNGSVLIDLRGLGSARTLTLVNGQRVVDGGDFQTIPSTMIERVEILKDGASAVYGADAVAGVVNIITRRDFEGLELNVQTADFSNMLSGAQESISLIAGKNFGDGNFVFGAEFVDQEQAFQSDTPWAFMQSSYYIYPEGGCERQLTAPYNGTASGGCYAGGSSRIPESRLSFMNQGLFLIGTPATAPYEVGLMQEHDGRSYNYAPVNYIQTPYERTNIFAEGHFDLTDNIRFNAEVRGNDRASAQQLAPLPFTGGDPMYDGNFNGVAYSGVSEDNYYLRRAVDAYNATGPETPLVYEPLVTPRRRMIETNRRFEQEVSQFQWVASLEGTVNDIDWNIYWNEGSRSRTDRDFGQFSGVRLFNAMGPSADLDGDGQPECYGDITDASTLIVGCVPLNMFGGGEVNAAGQPTVTTLTPDMVDYVALDTVDTLISKQQSVGFGFNGSSFDLPGGEVGWAAGYARWTQELTYTPDSAKTIGAVTGNVGAGTMGTLTNDSVYGEFLAPVFDNGLQALAISGGVRYDDWDVFGSDTTWQAGIEFQALESLKLRATAGTVFRAPTIGNLFGGVVDNFPTYSDPCVPPEGDSLPPGCAQVGIQTDSQLHALVGGNPNLTPESGETFTAGAVWNTGLGNGDLTLTADYWQTDLEDGISSLGVQFILDDCYINENASSCALVTRTAGYDIFTVRDGTLNVADQGAQGIDLEVRYGIDTRVGQFEAALLWTHLLERTKTPFAGAAQEELAGTYTDVTDEDGGAYPGDKANVSLQWYRDNLSIGYLGEFVGAMDTAAAFVDYQYKLDAEFYHDIVGSYTFAQTGTDISVGVTNLTDEPPPYIDLGFNGKTDVAAYRLFGRGYYLRLTQSFE